jgi:TPR repeat protein
MLRDLFLSAGVSVSDAARLRVYLVVKECAKRGRVCLPHDASSVAVVHFNMQSGGGFEKQYTYAKRDFRHLGFSASPGEVTEGKVRGTTAGDDSAHLRGNTVFGCYAVNRDGGTLESLRLLDYECNRQWPDRIEIVSGRWCLQIFAALEQLHGARVFLRVCNAQGAALVRIQLAPAAQRLRLRTLVPVYEMAMGHRQRLRGMGCGGRGRLALLMSQGGGGGEPVPRDCSALMDRIVRRVAAAQVAATPEGLHAQAQALWAVGDFAAAAALLQQAVRLGHVLSRAELADMLIGGREGVAMDYKRAFELMEEGARLGCCHSQGVMARCYLFGLGCSKDGARSLALARASAGEGSKYGQWTLGKLYREGEGGVVQDYAVAVAQFRLAAAQGDDGAQNELGFMHHMGYGVAKDKAEALWWYKLAAAQGLGAALCGVGLYYEDGCSVAANRAEAIRWYKRADAAGLSEAADAETADALKRLGA